MRSSARGADHVEAVVVVLCALGALVAVPVAAAVGTEVYVGTSAAARREQATRIPAEATVLVATPAGLSGSGGAALPHSFQAPVEWFAGGERHTGMASVPEGTRVGEHQTVWLDVVTGEPVSQPTRATDAVTSAITVAVLVLMFALVGLVVLCATAHSALDRLRLRGWAEEWARVGPRWSHHTP
ncbi:hypothetical protein V5P93_003606 [Actinokineospora auranticolor]|uniref:Rv1733c family protein n=1 Tax=Actinokineospora auranticolor TaxID=155976 RepID=UPI0011B0C03C|nr:hypothetical protein [Actinokineospora auranticolor]